MNGVRVVVEWSYADVYNLWRTIQFGKQLKTGMGHLGVYCNVAILLTNCHTCLKGSNRTSKYFNLNPPTLDDYLAMAS